MAVPLQTLACHVSDHSYEKLRELQLALAVDDKKDKAAELLQWTRESISLVCQLYACAACVNVDSAEQVAFSRIREAADQGMFLANRASGAVDAVGSGQAQLALWPKPVYDVSSSLHVCGLGDSKRQNIVESTTLPAAVITHICNVANSLGARSAIARAAAAEATAVSGSGWPSWGSALASDLEVAQVARPGVTSSFRAGKLPIDAAATGEIAARARVTDAILERLPRCVAAARHLIAAPLRLLVTVDRTAGHLIIQVQYERGRHDFSKV
jgi:hypothetical protein